MPMVRTGVVMTSATGSSPWQRSAMRRVTSCSVMIPFSRPLLSTTSAEVALAALMRPISSATGVVVSATTFGRRM